MEKIISECQSSGMSVKSWCDQNGFSEQSYYYYLKKIREDELSKLPVPIPTDNTKPAVFKKLEVRTHVADTRAAVIIRLGSATVEVNEGASQQTVQEQFHLDPFSNTLFLFCGRKRNRMEALLWEGDGFILLKKVHSVSGESAWKPFNLLDFRLFYSIMNREALQ